MHDKALWQVFVLQRSHSNEINYCSYACSNKRSFAKWADLHKSETCRTNFFECIRCVKVCVGHSKVHRAGSHMCLILIREAKLRYKNLLTFTWKKLIMPCQSRKSLQVSRLNAQFINNKACHIHDSIYCLLDFGHIVCYWGLVFRRFSNLPHPWQIIPSRY